MTVARIGSVLNFFVSPSLVDSLGYAAVLWIGMLFWLLNTNCFIWRSCYCIHLLPLCCPFLVPWKICGGSRYTFSQSWHLQGVLLSWTDKIFPSFLLAPLCCLRPLPYQYLRVWLHSLFSFTLFFYLTIHHRMYAVIVNMLQSRLTCFLSRCSIIHHPYSMLLYNIQSSSTHILLQEY